MLKIKLCSFTFYFLNFNYKIIQICIKIFAKGKKYTRIYTKKKDTIYNVQRYIKYPK